MPHLSRSDGVRSYAKVTVACVDRAGRWQTVSGKSCGRGAGQAGPIRPRGRQHEAVSRAGRPALLRSGQSTSVVDLLGPGRRPDVLRDDDRSSYKYRCLLTSPPSLSTTKSRTQHTRAVKYWLTSWTLEHWFLFHLWHFLFTRDSSVCIRNQHAKEIALWFRNERQHEWNSFIHLLFFIWNRFFKKTLLSLKKKEITMEELFLFPHSHH